MQFFPRRYVLHASIAGRSQRSNPVKHYPPLRSFTVVCDGSFQDMRVARLTFTAMHNGGIQ